MIPISAINEWSCALACIEATLQKHGLSVTQSEIIKAHIDLFPTWKAGQEGLLGKVEMLYLLEVMGFNFGYILNTDDKDEFLAGFTKYIGLGRYWASFLIFHHPTNHCNAIVSLNAQSLTLMNPDQANPAIYRMTFADAHATRRPEYILLAV